MARRVRRYWRELIELERTPNLARKFLNLRFLGVRRDRAISGAREHSLLGKIGIVFFLILFCLHSSRFYAVGLGCWHGQSNGYSFQHCKDVPNGVGIRLAQPAILPTAVSPEAPETAWGHPPKHDELMLDHYLSPPFHPPRQLVFPSR